MHLIKTVEQNLTAKYSYTTRIKQSNIFMSTQNLKTSEKFIMKARRRLKFTPAMIYWTCFHS